MSNYEAEGTLRSRRGELTPPANPIEAWKRAPAQVVDYPAERVVLPDGTTYTANEGKRLLINGIPVMDTCEGPWADKTVELAFGVDKIKSLNPTYKLKVLERGFGLHITGDKIIRKLLGRMSGEYHIIELNDEVANMAEEWKKQREKMIALFQSSGTKCDIKIFIHRGEAKEVTRRLILDEGKKFNLVLSDTYPLEKDENGINDIEDLDVISRGLYKHNEGVFAFFPYDAATEGVTVDGYVTAKQSAMLRQYFPNRLTAEAEIKPPRSYSYLFHENGMPARKLPVIVCTKNGS